MTMPTVALPVALVQAACKTDSTLRYLRNPMRASVIDLIRLATGQKKNTGAAVTMYRLLDKYPELKRHLHMHQFPGSGQRLTPITDVAGMVNFFQVLRGDVAQQFRENQAQLTIRFLGGDEDLIEQIKHIHETTTEENNPFKEDVTMRKNEQQSKKRDYPLVDDESVKASYLQGHHVSSSMFTKKRKEMGMPLNSLVYAIHHNKLNLAASNMTAKQLKARTGKGSGRQNMTTQELQNVQQAQTTIQMLYSKAHTPNQVARAEELTYQTTAKMRLFIEEQQQYALSQM